MNDLHLLNTLLALFLIIFKATGDGLQQRGLKGIGGFINSIYTAVITLICFAYIGKLDTIGSYNFYYVWTLLGFLLLRFGMYDFIRNAAAGDPLFYIGTTKWYDRFFRWFFIITKQNPAEAMWLPKLISILIGLSFLTGLNPIY